MCSRLNDWNVILLRISNTHNDENDDVEFTIILNGVEARISRKILSYMYETMRIDDEDIDGYQIVQF